jgi:hypothetical protein
VGLKKVATIVSPALSVDKVEKESVCGGTKHVRASQESGTQVRVQQRKVL